MYEIWFLLSSILTSPWTLVLLIFLTGGCSESSGIHHKQGKLFRSREPMHSTCKRRAVTRNNPEARVAQRLEQSLLHNPSGVESSVCQCFMRVSVSHVKLVPDHFRCHRTWTDHCRSFRCAVRMKKSWESERLCSGGMLVAESCPPSATLHKKKPNQKSEVTAAPETILEVINIS